MRECEFIRATTYETFKRLDVTDLEKNIPRQESFDHWYLFLNTCFWYLITDICFWNKRSFLDLKHESTDQWTSRSMCDEDLAVLLFADEVWEAEFPQGTDFFVGFVVFSLSWF